MKRIFHLAVFVSISCSTPKPEPLTDGPVQQNTVITAVEAPAREHAAITSPADTAFNTISVKSNIVLAGVASYPFSKELYEIKAILDSLGISAEFVDGENGGLSYDSAEISCNRSYGESICEADIQSRLITLSNGMKLGISLDDFLMRAGINANPAAKNVRYKYTYSANEHAYILQFDFANRKLIRFYYQKDPCVIYD